MQGLRQEARVDWTVRLRNRTRHVLVFFVGRGRRATPLIFAPKGRMFVDRGIWNVLRKIRGCDRLIAVI